MASLLEVPSTGTTVAGTGAAARAEASRTAARARANLAQLRELYRSGPESEDLVVDDLFADEAHGMVLLTRRVLLENGLREFRRLDLWRFEGGRATKLVSSAT